jgi:hypothetical protein
MVDKNLAVLSFEVCPHELRVVCLQTVPNDEQLVADAGLQSPQKLDDLRARSSH